MCALVKLQAENNEKISLMTLFLILSFHARTMNM